MIIKHVSHERDFYFFWYLEQVPKEDFRKSAAQGIFCVFPKSILFQFFLFSTQGQLVPSVPCLRYLGHGTRESCPQSGKGRNLPDSNIEPIFLLQSKLIQVVVNSLSLKVREPNSKLNEVAICKSVVIVFSTESLSHCSVATYLGLKFSFLSQCETCV